MGIAFGMIFQAGCLSSAHIQTSDAYYPIVLGVPHPAVYTRDVALYQVRSTDLTDYIGNLITVLKPFRNALRSPHQVIGLQTLAWQLMCRRCQEGQHHPVRIMRGLTK